MPEHPPVPASQNGGARIYRFEPYRFGHNLAPQTRDKLKEIFAHWNESERAEALVREILDEAPDTLGVRIVAYRFYFYRRRSLEAAHWALSCLEWLSERLELPADWRTVTADMADFIHWHAYPRLWLQSLTAYAYNMARLGREQESLAALAKVEELDPEGKLGAARLRQVFTDPCGDAGMIFSKQYETWRAPFAPGQGDAGEG
jgi:tetratricopeptide (TPR) repeat protein